MAGKRSPEEVIREFEQIFGAGGFGHADFWDAVRGRTHQQPPIWESAHSRASEPTVGTQTLEIQNPITGQWQAVPCDFDRK